MPFGKEILLGAGLLLAAGILIARLLGVDVPLGTLIPVAAILGGAAIAWMQLDETRRAGLVDKTKADQAGGWARLAAGLALVVAGVLVWCPARGPGNRPGWPCWPRWPCSAAWPWCCCHGG